MKMHERSDAMHRPRLRLRHPLFWKILVGFWLTFIAITEGVWVITLLYQNGHDAQARDRTMAQRDLRIETARTAIKFGGMPALRSLTEGWPEEQRRYLHVVLDEQGGSDRDPRELTVTAPDGTRYLVDYHPPPPPRPRMAWLHVPPELLLLGVFGGLLFSVALAVYLTRPLRRLRQGFERFAGGDLGVRVLPAMRGRRDEIAELAGDFDRMAGRIEQLVKAREQLLHDVSHELRSPLARMTVALELVHKNPSRTHDFLKRIESEIRRLDRMVGDAMTLSRAEHPDRVIEDGEYVDLAALVRSVAQDAGFEVQASNIEVQVHIDDRLDDESERSITVRGSVELMHRMLENIVRNALRFSVEGDCVRISLYAHATRGEAHIIIEDQGPGVPDEELSRMFDPFVRVNQHSENTGYGLGLAIARRAAVAHGGRIVAENMRPHGLRVTIMIPCTM